MDDAGKQLEHGEMTHGSQGAVGLEEGQREARERALLVEKLALRVLDECRVSLMLSFRYLDIALWKLPFVARQQRAALSTDGTSLFFNPDLVVLRFKASPNELIRDYLQVVLHCVLRHPFEAWRREPQEWSLACDLCVEAIAMEMSERLYPSVDDEKRHEMLRILRHEVDVITPARVYRSLVDAAGLRNVGETGRKPDGGTANASGLRAPGSLKKGGTWQLEDAMSFLEAVERMRSLFWRDDHEPWKLLKLDDEPSTPPQSSPPDDSDNADEDCQPDDSQQDDAGAGQEEGNAEGTGGAEDTDGADGNSGDADSGDPREDEDGQGKEGGQGDADDGLQGEHGSGDSDAAGDRKSPDEPEFGEEPEAAGEGEQASAGDTSQQATAAAVAAAVESAGEDGEDDFEERTGQAGEFAPAFGEAGQADMYGYVEKDLRDIVDMARLSEVEWADISKRIEADLRTMSSMRGYEAGTFLANLALVNRSRINYADFLRRFSTAVEDANMSDDEFDYIYYMYGLERYGNMPLVEPLESRETFRVRDFVIALDTSGSTTGELERLFVTRTLELLRQSARQGEEVNIHIVQCDSEIRKVTVITDINQLDAFGEEFEVRGMGGTDFRPVFTYVDDLRQQGYFGNLRGLLYFTDGLGVFPATPPPYDTAFVFVEDEGKEMKVPPWAMKVVLDEDMIREW